MTWTISPSSSLCMTGPLMNVRNECCLFVRHPDFSWTICYVTYSGVRRKSAWCMDRLYASDVLFGGVMGSLSLDAVEIYHAYLDIRVNEAYVSECVQYVLWSSVDFLCMCSPIQQYSWCYTISTLCLPSLRASSSSPVFPSSPNRAACEEWNECGVS